MKMPRTIAAIAPADKPCLLEEDSVLGCVVVEKVGAGAGAVDPGNSSTVPVTGSVVRVGDGNEDDVEPV